MTSKKTFSPKFILPVFLWILLFLLVFFFSPSLHLRIIFFLLLFLSFFFSLRLFIKQIKLIFLASFYLVCLPLLLFFDQFRPLNLALLSAFFGSLYFLIKQFPS